MAANIRSSGSNTKANRVSVDVLRKVKTQRMMAALNLVKRSKMVGRVDHLEIDMESQKEVAEERGAEELEANRRQKIEEMFARLRKYRGKLPADFKFNREGANERH